ncbi:MAG TPA: TIGR02530 family flagellar biosynthesis protein [Clostridia bacterium]|nr:TIGR02530 family flagellar biosynthesis protein [Clostridia bacterium]
MRLDNLLVQYSTKISAEKVRSSPSDKSTSAPGESFANLLESKLQGKSTLSFSKHAQLRMTQRNMVVSDLYMEKLDDAIKKAEKQGLKNTLVLMDKMAFIVNVPKNVVITAMKDQDIEGNVFKEIDGAVVM